MIAASLPQSLMTDTLHWVNAVLHNDETSTDEEMAAYFVTEGLSEADAARAVDQRQRCLLDMHYVATL